MLQNTRLLLAIDAGVNLLLGLVLELRGEPHDVRGLALGGPIAINLCGADESPRGGGTLASYRRG